MWATPLQLATAVSIVANRGKVLQPRMLKAVEGVEFEPLIENPIPDVMVSDPDYWRYIEEAMTMVVHRPFSRTEFRDYGTAYEAIAQADRGMPYKMAGKSGSAQVVGISQEIRRSTDIIVSDLNKDHGLFISYAPAENSQIGPQIAVAVFVENGEHGSSAAGPIAKQVIDTYLLDILGIDFAALAMQAEEELMQDAIIEDPTADTPLDELPANEFPSSDLPPKEQLKTENLISQLDE